MSTTAKSLQPEPEARPLDELLKLPPDAILNPEEARIYARLKSRQAIYNWIGDKKDPLPATKRGRWQIRKGDLDAYLRKKHNRRASDRAAADDLTNEGLREVIAQLIEIGQAVIAWKRAQAVYHAANNAAFLPGATGEPDMEWINSAYDEMQKKRESIYALTSSLSEQQLTALRFMLPSITSDLALAGTAPAGEAQDEPRASAR